MVSFFFVQSHSSLPIYVSSGIRSIGPDGTPRERGVKGGFEHAQELELNALSEGKPEEPVEGADVSGVGTWDSAESDLSPDWVVEGVSMPGKDMDTVGSGMASTALLSAAVPAVMATVADSTAPGSLCTDASWVAAAGVCSVWRSTV